MTTRATLLKSLLRRMLLLRRFEEYIVDEYPKQEMKTPVHLYIGQEAIAAGVGELLRHEDYAVTTHRSHAHCLAKGACPEALYAEFYGRVTGCCKGMGGSMHPAFPDLGIIGTSAIVGGGIPHGVGLALAIKLRHEQRISAVFFGDGASEEGAFHESLNFAALKKLPVLFVCENNGYATVSPLSSRQPAAPIADRARGYGISAETVDGNDVEAVYEAAKRAVEFVRGGLGPAFLECTTYRWKGHVGCDEDWARGGRPKLELDEWKKRCPIAMACNKLFEIGYSSAEYDIQLTEINDLLTRAIRNAKAAPMPPEKQLGEFLFREGGC